MPTTDRSPVLTRRRGLQWFAVVAASGLLAACQQAAPAGPAQPAPAPTTPPKPTTTTVQSAAPTSAPAAAAAAAAPAQTAPTTAPAAAARSGGSFVNQLGSDPTMNPVVGPDSASNIVNSVIFNQLTRVDKDTLQPSPDLATKWTPDADGLGWTFNLRSDVKYTFDRILDPATNTRLRGDFSIISEVQVVDPATVHFKLKKPFALLPVFMSYTAGIVPKHILESQDINTASDFNSKQPVGTGPFKVKECVSGSHVTLVANPDYFRGKPKLDSLTFKIVPDINTITAQVNTGELEFARVTANVLDAVAHTPDIDIYSANFMNWSYVGPNLTNPMFQDKRVRQAMAFGIDRQPAKACSTIARLPTPGPRAGLAVIGPHGHAGHYGAVPTNGI